MRPPPPPENIAHNNVPTVTTYPELFAGRVTVRGSDRVRVRVIPLQGLHSFSHKKV